MHDDSSDVQTVVLTTQAGRTFTLRFTLSAAGKLFAEAHNALNSVACLRSVSYGGNPAPSLRLQNTVDEKVI